ncbi:oxidoreductase [Flavivirga aquatica]|uniref:Oxidoreductase n=1 Tax=Flavivirga aquatica TaxID=1849968 RepID=A0A1E5T8W2_9FLAO|nr:aldo/keto reductase [Flavivirga aquatica]OEK07813.1 oxidoreductase [Flavivirga aquatica]
MSTNKTITKIGLGLAALGRPEYINIRSGSIVDKSEEAFKSNALSVLDEAYNFGVRYFDSAPSYGKGEAFLEAWNTARKHKDVILGTKWGYTYLANWKLGFKGQHEVKEHSLTKLLEQWGTSKNMFPELKIYQVHSATFESGILENKEVLKRLYSIKKEIGLQIGITTSGANQKEVIETALKVQVDGELLFDSFQVTYNIFEQSTLLVLKKVLQQGKSVIIKEALANGRVFKNENFQHYGVFYKKLSELSQKYQVGEDAIALRFIIDSLQPTYVLSGASNTNQLKLNLKALDFNLTEQELDFFKSIKESPKKYWEERSLLSWN